MTIRNVFPWTELDNKQLAALLAPALLRPCADDAVNGEAERVGSGWLLWGEVLKDARDPRES